MLSFWHCRERSLRGGAAPLCAHAAWRGGPPALNASGLRVCINPIDEHSCRVDEEEGSDGAHNSVDDGGGAAPPIGQAEDIYLIYGSSSRTTTNYNRKDVELHVFRFSKISTATNNFSPENKIGEAWVLWREIRELELVDPTLRVTGPRSEMSRCVHVALPGGPAHDVRCGLHS
ncbi:hypothetical protein Taro_040769 [Colocasia esculenta]|uniref:Uncharacterized protein n=1 Tax=Colocasia esculenta TaxID=4460 RepID=A0A843WCP4_COLES|nr:hypothetical protein [Colocasia esculenta]